ncbi:MAG TPA: homoserine kinase [Pedomonas sp.]|uniref:homoserine kinase n=1 Tax=Pedomonas sp. TaxID=2976421 RepID=UPI002F42D966
MAVYTHVPTEMLEAFLADFNIGHLLSAKGIAEGVENSNYLIETEQGRYILTLYEKRVKLEDLPYFLGLTGHLADAHLPVPRPIPNSRGETLHTLAGRPACLIEFLKGVSLTEPTAEHCRPVGAALARLHQAAASFPLSRPNDLSVDGWRRLAAAVRAEADTISPGLRSQIDNALADIGAAWPGNLPSGPIHADLFPDNVLVIDTEVTGLIDFYFAANDAWAYDVAVCLNAWCFSADGTSYRQDLTEAFLAGYESVRPLEPREREALPLLCQGAALRFLLTRAYDWLNTPADAIVTRKDPLAYSRRLAFFQAQAASLFAAA